MKYEFSFAHMFHYTTAENITIAFINEHKYAYVLFTPVQAIRDKNYWIKIKTFNGSWWNKKQTRVEVFASLDITV